MKQAATVRITKVISHVSLTSEYGGISVLDVTSGNHVHDMLLAF
jgi:hypothetical protein